IAPNLILTARHCIAPTSADSVECSTSPAYFSRPFPVRNLWVNRTGALSGALGSFGNLPTVGGSDRFFPVAEVHVPDTDAVCGVCSGAAGGPALDAHGRVVGVASRSKDCADSVYSAPASFAAFIRQITPRAERLGNYPEPDWLTPAPAPPPPTPVVTTPTPI